MRGRGLHLTQSYERKRQAAPLQKLPFCLLDLKHAKKSISIFIFILLIGKYLEADPLEGRK